MFDEQQSCSEILSSGSWMWVLHRELKKPTRVRLNISESEKAHMHEYSILLVNNFSPVVTD